MKYSVEIGTDEQKKLILNELSIFDVIMDELSEPPALTGIVVPADFDAKVNELQNTTTYISSRGQTAIAKTLPLESGTVIVLSPMLYTDYFDTQVRIAIYLHELFHCINGQEFKCSPSATRSERLYFDNISILFDEYYVDRRSFEILHAIFENKSIRYKKWVYGCLKGNIRTLLDDKYYETIRTEIWKFRIHGKGEIFWKNCLNFIDEPLKAMVHAFATIDSHPRLGRLNACMSQSRFINSATVELSEYFRNKYMSNGFDLIEGVGLMRNIFLNYGLRFEDTEQGGLRCNIQDI